MQAYAKDYSSLREDPRRLDMRERNDCTVIATAIVTGSVYADAHAAVASFGRVNNRGAYPQQYHAAIRSLGFTIIRAWDGDLKSKTMATIGRELARKFPGTKALVSCHRHVAAFNGSEIADWTAGRRHRVTSVHFVVPTKPATPVDPIGTRVPKPAPAPAPVAPTPVAPTPVKVPKSNIKVDTPAYHVLNLARRSGSVTLAGAGAAYGLTDTQVRKAIDQLRRQGYSFNSAGRGTGQWYFV